MIVDLGKSSAFTGTSYEERLNLPVGLILTRNGYAELLLMAQGAQFRAYLYWKADSSQ
jgi:hypothetical protein